MTHGFFITGTNTEVGKTYVGTMIARELVSAGHKVGVYKAVESGCRREGDQLIAADALALWQAAGEPGDLALACPQRFEAPLAPPQAAKLEGNEVDRQLLRTGFEYWKDKSDVVLAEGAGGLMSPLSDDDYNLDLAKDLGLPLIVVAVNELGTINATMTTLITARTLAPELPIAGVVLNQVAARADDPSITTNAEDIAARAGVPLLATVDYQGQGFNKTVDWFQLK